MPKTKHSMCGSPTYLTWISMRQRCLNRNQRIYKNYGGRGITICDRWLSSFNNFYEDMGPRPHQRSIDRIDNEGNYEPSNCRWATNKEQANNTRANRKFKIDGKIMTASDLVSITGVPRQKLIHYLDKGYTIEKIMRYKSLDMMSAYKRVVKIDNVTGEVMQIFNTAKEAGIDSLIPPSSVSKCCRKLEHHNTAGGYKWEFFDEEKHIKQKEPIVIDYSDSPMIPLSYYICGDKHEYLLKI